MCYEENKSLFQVSEFCNKTISDRVLDSSASFPCKFVCRVEFGQILQYFRYPQENKVLEQAILIWNSVSVHEEQYKKSSHLIREAI